MMGGFFLACIILQLKYPTTACQGITTRERRVFYKLHWHLDKETMGCNMVDMKYGEWIQS